MSKKRQQLIDTAIELFNEHGFHGVGIDRIATQANVTKKTMYNHFRSKDELILAALKHKDGLFRNEFMKAVEASGDTPKARLLSIFDVAQAWFADHKFYGCMFINAVGEYSDAESPIRAACADFKRQMLAYIEKLAIEAELQRPAEVAASLAILLEGATVTAQVSGDPGSADTARRAATVLVEQSAAA